MNQNLMFKGQITRNSCILHLIISILYHIGKLDLLKLRHVEFKYRLHENRLISHLLLKKNLPRSINSDNKLVAPPVSHASHVQTPAKYIPIHTVQV